MYSKAPQIKQMIEPNCRTICRRCNRAEMGMMCTVSSNLRYSIRTGNWEPDQMSRPPWVACNCLSESYFLFDGKGQKRRLGQNVLEGASWTIHARHQYKINQVKQSSSPAFCSPGPVFVGTKGGQHRATQNRLKKGRLEATPTTELEVVASMCRTARASHTGRASARW